MKSDACELVDQKNSMDVADTETVSLSLYYLFHFLYWTKLKKANLFYLFTSYLKTGSVAEIRFRNAE